MFYMEVFGEFVIKSYIMFPQITHFFFSLLALPIYHMGRDNQHVLRK